jgi:Ca-activated chloride channel family protein
MSCTVRLLLLAFVSGTWLSAQVSDYTLRVDVPFVSVDVTVQDDRGKVVDDLSRESFELYEDGIPQEIRYFSPVSTPYNIFLLFDRSGSTQDKWPLMQRAVAGFIATLRPQDHIAIAAFDSELQRELAWTNDRQKALLALPQLILPRRIGGTDFYGAVERTLRNEFRKTADRRALIVLTDGRDTSIYRELMLTNRLPEPEEDHRYQRVLKLARNQHIPIYVIAFNTDRNLESNILGADEYQRLQIIFPHSSVPERYLVGVRARMEELAEVSAGRILFPREIEEIVPLYQQIGRDIGTSYTIGYVSSNIQKNPSFRRVEVRTKNGSFHVTQSRNGYYAR